MSKKKIISVLGDSISTFAGYTPRMMNFYDTYIQEEAGISSVEDTWWMRVIRHMDGVLGSNDSIAGSTVSGNVSLSATSRKRHQNLAINGRPDCILLYVGTNDWAYSVLPDEFEEAYRDMLYSLTTLYPYADIYCATLLRGQEPADSEDCFFNVDGCISPMIYSSIIRNCVKEADLKLVDLEQYHMEYSTIDGVHPNACGMKMIADLWIKELK